MEKEEETSQERYFRIMTKAAKAQIKIADEYLKEEEIALKVKELKEKILDLSILEENKDLKVWEVVERADEEINKLFGKKK